MARSRIPIRSGDGSEGPGTRGQSAPRKALGDLMRVRTRLSVVTAIGAVAILGLAGCAAPEQEEAPPPAAEETEAPMMDPAFDDLVGPGCEAYAAQVPDGGGS